MPDRDFQQRADDGESNRWEKEKKREGSDLNEQKEEDPKQSAKWDEEEHRDPNG